MVESRKEITKEEYERLKYDLKELRNFALEAACNSPYPPFGYGFYDYRVAQEGDKYFVTWEHWDSCD